MQFTSTTTQKGQATIPVAIRKKLGIKPYSKVVFEMKNNKEATIRPITDFFELQGSIKTRKQFDIEAMDKSISKYFKNIYEKKTQAQ
jgi:AbrB family looped-hinge helix DNA binding protein